MNLSFQVTEYPRYQTEAHYRLFNTTWKEYFDSGAQARIPLETFVNLYENNPAGPAFLALAQRDEEWAGAVSAIPFRIKEKDNSGFLAYQISDIMVSPAYRNQGIFSRLLAALTEYLSRIPRTVIFVFPNRRSRPGSRECGYRAAKILPTRFYFPGPAAGVYRIDYARKTYYRFRRPVARFREVDLRQAGEIIENGDLILPRLVRDRSYLEWRYCRPGNQDRFQFLAIDDIATGETSLAITTQHRYGKRNFSVLLELLPQINEKNRAHQIGLLLGIGRSRGAGLLFSNEKFPGGGLFSPAWGISLPERFNPRPIELLVYPKPDNREWEEAFLNARFTTADWLGFL